MPIWNEENVAFVRVQEPTVAERLLQEGVATVRLPKDCQQVVARAMALFRQVLANVDEKEVDEDVICGDDNDESDDDGTPAACDRLPPRITPGADSAHCTGYHSYGGLSRYNQHRRGLVFSDACHTVEITGVPEFADAAADLFNVLHGVWQHVLRALAVSLELPTADWFEQNLGPTREHCQWHLKEYKSVAGVEMTSNDTNNNDCLLDSHTDPSLLSIVVHDRPGVQPDGYGLEYFTVGGQWREVDATGHGVAVVLLGSVWNVVGPQFRKACRHRVAASSNSHTTRVAATLFGRPASTARLVPLPIDASNHDDCNDSPKLSTPLTFGEWSQRVARRYEKKKTEG